MENNRKNAAWHDKEHAKGADKEAMGAACKAYTPPDVTSYGGLSIQVGSVNLWSS